MAQVTPFNEYNERQKNPTVATDIVDFADDTIKVAAVTATYTPDYDAHVYFSDITNEVTGSGYTAGGETLVTTTVVRASNVTTVDFADPSWAQNAAGFADARRFIFYKDTGVASTSILIASLDATVDVGNVAGALTLIVNAAGFFTSTASASA